MATRPQSSPAPPPAAHYAPTAPPFHSTTPVIALVTPFREPSDSRASVAVRNQVSTLKHTIRHQQAQLHNLENVLLRGPRKLQDDDMTSPPPSSYVAVDATPTKVKRRSSYDILQGIAGRDSSLPLPKKDVLEENGIQEGIPATPPSYKRVSSPTRTLSRMSVISTRAIIFYNIPARYSRRIRRSVTTPSLSPRHPLCDTITMLTGNARALADDGQNSSQRPPPSASSKLSPIDPDTSTSSLQPPSPNPSANRRISLTPGGTTKVLADLQTGVVNARNALENTKSQLRLSQRTVAQLTRQTEDLKEGRERLRLENEGLNNVVARKERLLQEVSPEPFFSAAFWSLNYQGSRTGSKSRG